MCDLAGMLFRTWSTSSGGGGSSGIGGGGAGGSSSSSDSGLSFLSNGGKCFGSLGGSEIESSGVEYIFGECSTVFTLFIGGFTLEG